MVAMEIKRFRFEAGNISSTFTEFSHNITDIRLQVAKKNPAKSRADGN